MSLGFSKSGRFRREFWIGGVLALLTIAVYAPVAGFGFVKYDDMDYVVNNGHIQTGLTKTSVAWAFTTGYAGNWHPLTWLSHIIDFQLYGLKPGGHHLTSLFFHVLNTLLLFGVLRAMTGATWRAAMVAALFAWHPLHVESVAWVSERKDVLSTFFGLLTLAAYARYARIGARAAAGQNGKLFYFIALLCFALGLLSKPMLVTWPFLLLLLDYWPLARTPGSKTAWPELLLEKAPFFLLSVISSIVTFQAQKAGGAMRAMEHLTLSARTANALVAYVRYLLKFVWPADLAFFYPLPPGWAAWRVIGSALLLLATTAGVVAKARSRPYLMVGWFWFLGMLVPVIGLVQVGVQSLADRYSYVPLIGIFIMLVWGLADLAQGWPNRRILLGTGGAMVLVCCLASTWFQLKTWQNSIKLFSHALAVTSGNFAAENLLGAALVEQGKYDEALQHYQAALKIVPGSPVALCNIGTLYFLEGKPQDATNYFQAALRREPDLAAAHHYLGRIFDDQGMPDEALAEYFAALAIYPEDGEAHKFSGVILARQGQGELALAHLMEAVRLRPRDAEAHFDLGLALVMQGRRDEAITSYRDAVRLQPDWPAALNDLAWLLATHPNPQLRDGPEAVRLAERACALSHESEARFLGTLDAAYAEAGRFPQAIATAEKAKTAALASGATNLATAAESRLALYQAGRPYHQE